MVWPIIMVIATVMGGSAAKAGVEPAGWIAFLNDIHFLHFTFYLFLLCLIVVIIVSLMTAPPAETFMRTASIDDARERDGLEAGEQIEDQLRNYVWRKEIFTSETAELRDLPWYKNYRILAVLLLILTFLVVGYFW